MTVNDYWVGVAMADDAVVAELLIRLKQQRASTKSPVMAALPFSWGQKQPRSRSRLTASVSRCDAAAVSTRCSPTTPLSWSGGASPSATADGYEDSSRRHHASRSKVLSLYIYLSTWICQPPPSELCGSRRLKRRHHEILTFVTTFSYSFDNFALDLFSHSHRPKASSVFRFPIANRFQFFADTRRWRGKSVNFSIFFVCFFNIETDSSSFHQLLLDYRVWWCVCGLHVFVSSNLNSFFWLWWRRKLPWEICGVDVSTEKRVWRFVSARTGSSSHWRKCPPWVQLSKEDSTTRFSSADKSWKICIPTTTRKESATLFTFIFYYK